MQAHSLLDYVHDLDLAKTDCDVTCEVLWSSEFLPFLEELCDRPQ